MTQITCYDPEGVAHTVEAVDAREYIKSGHYTAEPPELIATFTVPETLVALLSEPAPEPTPAPEPQPEPAPEPVPEPVIEPEVGVAPEPELESAADTQAPAATGRKSNKAGKE